MCLDNNFVTNYLDIFDLVVHPDLIYRSGSKVKVVGQSSLSQDEKCLFSATDGINRLKNESKVGKTSYGTLDKKQT